MKGKLFAIMRCIGSIVIKMIHFRSHKKLILLFFLLGFLFATFEIHADHDADVAQQTEHCCVQCCPSHNLAPVSQTITAVAVALLQEGFVHSNDSLPLQEIPPSIFRPPISLA